MSASKLPAVIEDAYGRRSVEIEPRLPLGVVEDRR